LKLALLLLLLLSASQPAALMLSIDSNGVVEAYLKISASEGLNEVKLPIEPIPETIEISMDNNITLIPLYEDGSLYFFAPESGVAEITYLVNITAEGSIFRFRIEDGGLIRLLLAPQVVLLTVPKTIENATYSDGNLLISFYGPEEIEYTIRQEEVAKTTTTTIVAGVTAQTEITSAQTTTAITMTSSTIAATTTATSEEIKEGVFYRDYGWIIFAIGLVALVAIIVGIFYRGRGSKAELTRGLSDVDLAILEAVKASGGSILQGRLQAELGLPKTTLWRHVKKLEKLGYLQIIKEGAFNRLVLLRDFE